MNDSVFSTWCLIFLLAMGGGCNSHIANSAMQPGDLTRAKNDARSVKECMRRISDIIHDELSDPTERRIGFGGGMSTMTIKLRRLLQHSATCLCLRHQMVSLVLKQQTLLT